MLNFICSGNGNIIVNLDGENICIHNDHPNHSQVIEALKAKDEAKLREVVDICGAVKQYVGSDVEIAGNTLTYRGTVLSGYLVDRILEQMRKGFGYEPMCAFLSNMFDNPEPYSIEQLFPFLEQNGLVLTDDGCFLGYKYVTKDSNGDLWAYTNNPDGTHNNNNPGEVVRMPRSEVVLNPDQACASGLHVGSPDYVSGQPHIVLVKVNPKNAVSVPHDYNHGKLRCCEYTVIQTVELTKEQTEEGHKHTYCPGITNVASDGYGNSQYAPVARGSLDNPTGSHWDN